MDTSKLAEHRDHLFSISPYCTYCGNPIAKGKQTLDHIIPLSQQGSNHPSNLVLCCLKCNLAKGNMSLEQWIERLIHVLKQINRGHIIDYSLGYAFCTQCRDRITVETHRQECPGREVITTDAIPKMRPISGPSHLWQRVKGGKLKCARCGVTKRRANSNHRPCKMAASKTTN